MLKVYIDKVSFNNQKVRRLFVSHSSGPPIMLYDGRPGHRVSIYYWELIGCWEKLNTKEVR